MTVSTTTNAHLLQSSERIGYTEISPLAHQPTLLQVTGKGGVWGLFSFLRVLPLARHQQDVIETESEYRIPGIQNDVC